MISKTDVGARIEAQVIELLLKQDPALRLIARNMRGRRFEIDAVFERSDARSQAVELVFLEVRYRKSPGIEPLETVDARKQGRLKRGAEVFLSRYAGKATSMRFDVASVKGSSCRWVRNAF